MNSKPEWTLSHISEEVSVAHSQVEDPAPSYCRGSSLPGWKPCPLLPIEVAPGHLLARLKTLPLQHEEVAPGQVEDPADLLPVEVAPGQVEDPVNLLP